MFSHIWTMLKFSEYSFLEQKDVEEYLELLCDVDGYFENMLAISKEQAKNLIEHQDEPIDKNDWGMAVYTVNAMYDSLANSITFPAGILQAPIYDVKASYEENLGGIGYIIAHEITHELHTEFSGEAYPSVSTIPW